MARTNLLTEIQKFLKFHKMEAREFGKLAVNDEGIMMLIVQGRRLANVNYAKIRNFMYEYNRGNTQKEKLQNKLDIKAKNGEFAYSKANDLMMERGSEYLYKTLCREHPAIVRNLQNKQAMKKGEAV